MEQDKSIYKEDNQDFTKNSQSDDLGKQDNNSVDSVNKATLIAYLLS